MSAWTRFDDDDVELQGVIESVRSQFYFFTLNCLGSRGRACARQQFYITLLLTHKGLSRTGIAATSNMNLTLPPRSYDAELNRHLLREEHLTR